MAVTGVTSLRRKLKLLTPAEKKAIRVEIKSTGLNIQRRARSRVRVDTGRLRNSIAVETHSDGMGARIGTNVKYGPFVEFGTSRSRAFPYLENSFEEERPLFLSRLGMALDNAHRTVARN